MDPRATGPRREAGQATVEAIIALIVVLPVVAFALQMGWNVHCAHALDTAIEHARYCAGPDDAGEGEAAAAAIRELMVEASPELAAGTLEVGSASISYEAAPSSTADLPDSDFDDYRIATKNSAHGSVAVRAEIAFSPPRLLPFGPDGPMRRTIDSSRAWDASFELG